jgi:hypothetical protein
LAEGFEDKNGFFETLEKCELMFKDALENSPFKRPHFKYEDGRLIITIHGDLSSTVQKEKFEMMEQIYKD